MRITVRFVVGRLVSRTYESLEALVLQMVIVSLLHSDYTVRPEDRLSNLIEPVKNDNNVHNFKHVNISEQKLKESLLDDQKQVKSCLKHTCKLS